MVLYRKLIAGCLIACFSAIPLEATPLPAFGVFVFSSLCYGAEDSDGDKIVLIRAPEGITAIYWRTEGAVMAPLLAYGPAIKLDEHTGDISMRFVDSELPGDAGVYLLAGTISAEALVLKSNISGPIRLPRSQDATSRLPKCGR
jgi:hypothetical protein